MSKLEFYEKKIEIFSRKIDFLYKKANLLYWLIIVLIVGYITLSSNSYTLMLNTLNRLDNTMNLKYDRDLDTLDQALLLDKNGTYQDQRNKLKYEKTSEKNNFLEKTDKLRNKIHNYIDKFWSVGSGIALAVLTYLVFIFIKIVSYEFQISKIERKILILIRHQSDKVK